MFFDSWPDLMRIVVVAPVAYLGLVAILRISGKRTLAKLNAFDLVITVALGSTLATTLLSSEVAVAEGLLAFLVLVLLQFAITWASVRSEMFRSTVRSKPALLAWQGAAISGTLRTERITEEELEQAVRSSGLAQLIDAVAVILETDGTLSIITKSQGNAQALERKFGVEGPTTSG